jgi:hypothetical protein
MTQEDYRHPIAPPPELVQQLIKQIYGPENGRLKVRDIEVATFFARWGADQELEACCEALDNLNDGFWSEKLRAARRPKPPSLKEQALETLQRLSKDGYPCNYQEDSDWDTIRRALEQLPDNE